MSASYVVSEAQVELLKDQQVPAEQHPGHAHVAHGLTDDRHGRAAAIQLGQVDPGVQTCGHTLMSRTHLHRRRAGSPRSDHRSPEQNRNVPTSCDGSFCSTLRLRLQVHLPQQDHHGCHRVPDVLQLVLDLLNHVFAEFAYKTHHFRENVTELAHLSEAIGGRLRGSSGLMNSLVVGQQVLQDELRCPLR